jgi:DNA polymerase I-like protein with 3'-5' exonuclease and polymerase domains
LIRANKRLLLLGKSASDLSRFFEHLGDDFGLGQDMEVVVASHSDAFFAGSDTVAKIVELIELHNPSSILIVGKDCPVTMHRLGLVPKNRTIGSFHKQDIFIDAGAGQKIWVNGTYGPWSGMSPDVAHSIKWDAYRAKRCALTGSPAATHTGIYKTNPSIATLKGIIQGRIDDQVYPEWLELPPKIRVVIDLETVGLNEYALPTDNHPGAYIVSISITLTGGYSTVFYFESATDSRQPAMRDSATHTHVVNKELFDFLCFLFGSASITTCGANLKYDIRWMRRQWGIRVLNHGFDTLLAGSLLDENRPNSLSAHTEMFLPAMGGYDAPLNNTYDKGRMDLVPVEDLVPYAGGDTDACFQISHIFQHQLFQDTRLFNFYRLVLHPASIAFRAMEEVGIEVDLEILDDVKFSLEQRMADAETIVWALLPPKLRAKHSLKFKLSRPAIILDYMFGEDGKQLTPSMFTPGGKPQSALTHLNHFKDVDEDVHRFVDAVDDYSQCKKIVSTFIVGFLKHLRSDGMFHPTFQLYRGYAESGVSSGTVTGRLAAKEPPIQTLVKHGPIAQALRKAYIAKKGYVILEADYSQGELRIAACLSGDTEMLDAYIQGIDLHILTGCAITGYTLEEAMAMELTDPHTYAHIRQTGKSANFGLIYRISPQGYQLYCWAMSQKIITLEESEATHKAFFKRYPMLLTWHAAYVEWTQEHLSIRSPLGRVRHLENINHFDNRLRSEAERQAINSPVQATLSDLVLIALSRMHTEYSIGGDWPLAFKPFLMTHDSIGAYVLEEYAPEWAQYVRTVMEDQTFLTTEFGWTPQIPFPVDLKLGPNLAQLEKLVL